MRTRLIALGVAAGLLAKSPVVEAVPPPSQKITWTFHVTLYETGVEGAVSKTTTTDPKRMAPIQLWPGATWTCSQMPLKVIDGSPTAGFECYSAGGSQFARTYAACKPTAALAADLRRIELDGSRLLIGDANGGAALNVLCKGSF